MTVPRPFRSWRVSSTFSLAVRPSQLGPRMARPIVYRPPAMLARLLSLRPMRPSSAITTPARLDRVATPPATPAAVHPAAAAVAVVVAADSGAAGATAMVVVTARL